MLGPGLKLSAILLLILLHSDVYFLAVGYLVAGILGVIINTALLLRILRTQGMFQYLNLRTIQMPVREVFGFSIPLLTSDFVFVLRGSLVIILLEFFQSTVDVAAYRAVVPVARLNMVVLQSFTFLFMPLAARTFARNDTRGMNNLHWQSATWIAVISFPVFAVSYRWPGHSPFCCLGRAMPNRPSSWPYCPLATTSMPHLGSTHLRFESSGKCATSLLSTSWPW